MNELGPYSPITSDFLTDDVGTDFYTPNDPCIHLNGTWDYMDDDNGQGLDDGFYFYRMEVLDHSMQSVVIFV